MNFPDQVVYVKDAYDIDEKRLWETVGKQVELLTNNGYICVVKREEQGIIAISYSRDDRSYGGLYPVWLLPEEEESIVYIKNEVSDDESV